MFSVYLNILTNFFVSFKRILRGSEYYFWISQICLSYQNNFVNKNGKKETFLRNFLYLGAMENQTVKFGQCKNRISWAWNGQVDSIDFCWVIQSVENAFLWMKMKRDHWKAQFSVLCHPNYMKKLMKNFFHPHPKKTKKVQRKAFKILNKECRHKTYKK